MPTNYSPAIANLLKSILQIDSKVRPDVKSILNDPTLTEYVILILLYCALHVIS